MDHFDKKNSSYFDDTKGALPDGFAWEDVKEGIYAKQERKKRRFPFWWFTFGVSSMVLIIGVLVYLSTNTQLVKSTLKQDNYPQEIQVEMKEAANNDQLSSQVVKTQTSFQDNLDSSNGELSFDIGDSQLPKSKYKPSDNLGSAKVQDLKINKSSARKTIISSGGLKSKSILSERADIMNSGIVSSLIQNIGNESKEQIDKGVASDNSISQFSVINDEPILLLPLLKLGSLTNDSSKKELLVLDSYLEFVDDTNEKEEQISNYWELVSFAGVNVWNSSYSGNNELGKYRNMDTNQLLGFSASAGIQKMLNDRFFLGLDFGYSNWHSKFRSEYTKEYFKDTLVLVSESTNSLTGSPVSKEFEELNLLHKQNILIQHYNSFQAYSMGVQVGYKVPLSKKINVNLSLRGGFIFASNQLGRTYDENRDFVFYDNASPIFKAKGMSLRPGLQFSYLLTESVGIGMQLSHDKFISNWSYDGLDVKPGRTDLGIMLSFKL